MPMDPLSAVAFATGFGAGAGIAMGAHRVRKLASKQSLTDGDAERTRRTRFEEKSFKQRMLLSVRALQDLPRGSDKKSKLPDEVTNGCIRDQKGTHLLPDDPKEGESSLYIMSGALPNDSTETLMTQTSVLGLDLASASFPDLNESDDDMFSSRGMYRSRISESDTPATKSFYRRYRSKMKAMAIDGSLSETKSAYEAMTPHHSMLASLDLQLLALQIKRGGWWSAASTQPTLFQKWRGARPMSRFLARECTLAGHWKGRVLPSLRDGLDTNPMAEHCRADFSGIGHPEPDSLPSAQHTKSMFSTSICGKYFLAAEGSNIYTYEIDGTSIRLLSRTSCERRVLAVSIDASFERFAIAAILEGRIGIYVDLLNTIQSSPATSLWERAGTLTNTAAGSAPVMDFGDGATASNAAREIAVGDFDELSLNAASVGSSILHQSVEIVTQRSWVQYFHGPRARLRGMREMPASSNGVWPQELSLAAKCNGRHDGGDSSSHIVYRNICTEQDPPCSVAISPTRQCMAFGCKSGVELYWIDPTTGQNLNRWFPLTRPSDHLHFLPPRRHTDGSLRLRLISSPKLSSTNEDDADDSSPTENPQTHFWFTVASSWQFPLRRSFRQRVNTVDHSYAIPLSDGHHIVFTDNETGLLCLGSDRPASSVQRLSRKFIFEPPSTLGVGREPLTPNVYAATSGVSDGIRIVAAYGTQIVLYSVPADALRFSTAEQEHTIQDPPKPFEELEWIELLQHPTSNAGAVHKQLHGDGNIKRFGRLNMAWVHHLPASGGKMPESLDKLWPLKISGTRIGELDGPRALSVQESAQVGLVIWAFGESGLGKAWKLAEGRERVARYHYAVDREGVAYTISVD
ncbi:hypothetical protein LTR37_016192 [Vermiconidia calcicola]|uniref:Uncharacterized protein n=1 Tax=Vermiconidia calcicola TaxID=1690605 RepID=A0ACC3MNN0_9PEZI|nr:hypothetical protein LTR37_016192 [Vermiconidia calcicola]